MSDKLIRAGLVRYICEVVRPSVPAGREREYWAFRRRVCASSLAVLQKIVDSGVVAEVVARFERQRRAA